jgi:hypothetical protein
MEGGASSQALQCTLGSHEHAADTESGLDTRKTWVTMRSSFVKCVPPGAAQDCASSCKKRDEWDGEAADGRMYAAVCDAERPRGSSS